MASLLDQLQKQAQGYLGELEGLQGQMKSYTPIDPQAAMRDLQARVGFFKPQYEELAGLTQQAAGTPAALMKQYYDTYGGSAGPSAMDRLNQIQQQVGNVFGTREALSNALSTAGARIGDIAQAAANQYQSAQQGLQGQYDRRMQLYQLALQQLDAERARQQQLRLSTINNTMQPTTQPDLGPGQIDVTPRNVDELNYIRKLKGLEPVSEEYFRTTYNVPKVATPKLSEAVQEGWRQNWGINNKNANLKSKLAALIQTPGMAIGTGLLKLFGK